jgi:hypothetical protein
MLFRTGIPPSRGASSNIRKPSQSQGFRKNTSPHDKHRFPTIPHAIGTSFFLPSFRRRFGTLSYFIRFLGRDNPGNIMPRHTSLNAIQI